MKLACFIIIVLSLLPFGRAIYDLIKKWKEKKRGIKLISVLGWFFVSLLMTRIAEILYINFVSEPGNMPMGPSGVLIGIIGGGVHSFQSFSLDESYDNMIQAGIAIVQCYIPGSISEFISTLYFSIQNLAAPIAGGAILIDILVGVSAGLQIKWQKHKQKHVFSCTSEESICLAESIPNERKDKAIIFTDALLDDDDEDDVAIKEQLEFNEFIYTKDHLNLLNIKAKDAPIVFYLMDDDDEKNVDQLLDIWNRKEQLLEGCAPSQTSVVTVHFFARSIVPYRLVRSLVERCKDDPRFQIKIVDPTYNLVQVLSTKKAFVDKLDQFKGNHVSEECTVTIIGENMLFISEISLAFLESEYTLLGNVGDLFDIHIVSTLDAEAVMHEFESHTLILPEEDRQYVRPNTPHEWDGSIASLHDMFCEDGVLRTSGFIIIAGEYDLKNVQYAFAISKAFDASCDSDADKPVIACYVRSKDLGDQFSSLFPPNVIAFGSKEEVYSYSICI